MVKQLRILWKHRLRVLADWALNAATPAEATSFGVISSESVPLDTDKPRV